MVVEAFLKVLGRFLGCLGVSWGWESRSPDFVFQFFIFHFWTGFSFFIFSFFHFPFFHFSFFHIRNPFGSLYLDCQALLQNEGAYACAQGKAPWSLLDQTWLALALYRDPKDLWNDAEPLAPENCKHTAAALAQGSCPNHAQWPTSCKHYNLSSDSLVASAHWSELLSHGLHTHHWVSCHPALMQHTSWSQLSHVWLWFVGLQRFVETRTHTVNPFILTCWRLHNQLHAGMVLWVHIPDYMVSPVWDLWAAVQ